MSTKCQLALLGSIFFATAVVRADDYRLSGPYTHDNLSIYLIHGLIHDAARSHTQYLTLQQAMEQHKVAVYETGSVNQLAVENLSDRDIYIQSGDIVKGGKQDRVFPDDFILPAKSGRVPISSFCVEHGRWTRRGSESADRFEISNQTLPTKSLKMAARDARSQAGVWDQVSQAQNRFAESVGVSPASSQSPSSMQLTLENKQVSDVSGAYLAALTNVIDGKTDVIGYVFAINGKVNSAEMYTSNQLFVQMWPKMLRANAVEAMTERFAANALMPPNPADVRNFLRNAGAGRETSRPAGPRATVVRKDSQGAVMFESKDDASASWLHRSYLAK